MVATDGLSGVGTGGGKRIPRLEGLRGLLALGVLVYHIAFMAGIASFVQQPGHPFWGPLVDGLGVMLPPFFVLSGMFLYRPFARAALTGEPGPAVGRFLLRRALRILPGYWLIIAVGLLAINLYNINAVGDVLRPVLLGHFFFPEDQPMFGLEHTWTVPAELTFYLALPLLAWWGRRYAMRVSDPARRARRLSLPVAAFALFGLAWVVYTRVPSLVAAGAFAFQEYFWPTQYLHYFAGGMVLAVASAYGEVTDRRPALYRLVAGHPVISWGVVLAAYLVYGFRPFGEPVAGAWSGFVYEISGILAATLAAVVAVLLVSVPNGSTRALEAVLANRPMRYLGRISYGIYLWHVLFIEWWFRNGSLFGVPAEASVQWRGTAGFLELLAFTLVLTLVAATLSHYLLERPALRLARPHSPQTGEAAAAPPAGPAAPVAVELAPEATQR